MVEKFQSPAGVAESDATRQLFLDLRGIGAFKDKPVSSLRKPDIDGIHAIFFMCRKFERIFYESHEKQGSDLYEAVFDIDPEVDA